MCVDSNPKLYCIRVKERLDARWAAWLGELEIQYSPTGETMLTGLVVDQSALHGLLGRIRDLNLTLIAINEIQTQDPDQSPEGKGV